MAGSSGPVDPPVEPATLNAPEPAGPAITTKAPPSSYFGGPIAESVKDFEPVDDMDKIAELGEDVHGNADPIPPEPRHEQYRGGVIPTTEEVVHENANNVVLNILGKDLGKARQGTVFSEED